MWNISLDYLRDIKHTWDENHEYVIVKGKAYKPEVVRHPCNHDEKVMAVVINGNIYLM